MIRELLREQRSTIVRRWMESIVGTYPPETSTFLASENNRFSNPVGHAISECARRLFDEIVDGGQKDRMRLALDGLIKIRVVQDFSPSQAVGFIFSLRRIMIEELRQPINGAEQLIEFLEVESDIDAAALAAFEMYTDAREKIFQIRVKEMKSRSAVDCGEKP
jgi:hypothetical protein